MTPSTADDTPNQPNPTAQGPKATLTLKTKNFVARQWRTTSRRRKILTLLTISVIAALAALFLSGANFPGPVTFTEPQPPQPAPVTGTATTFLSPIQVEEYSVIYSALLAWSEITHQEALTGSPHTLAFILANPSVRCAREHRALRNQVLLGQAQAPPSWMDHVMDCARQDFSEQTEKLLADWQKMNQEERTARAAQALYRLWSAVDPALHTQAMLVFERGILPDPEKEEGFRIFRESYSPCQEGFHLDARKMAAEQATQTDIAKAWMEASNRMTACTTEITEKKFPLPTLEP